MVMAAPARRHPLHPHSEGGFTLAELLVATIISTLVLGGAVSLTSQMQTGYRRQVEDSAAQQEGRYALDWIGKLVRGAGNDPFNKIDVLDLDTVAPDDFEVGPCPEVVADPAERQLATIQFDPDGDGLHRDIRLKTDAFPPDGNIGGVIATECNQPNEDVTISFDAANKAILFYDNNLAPEASIRTDAVIEDLLFIYRDSNHSTTDALGNPITSANVVYVEIQITIRTRTVDPSTGAPVLRTMSSEVRVRTR